MFVSLFLHHLKGKKKKLNATVAQESTKRRDQSGHMVWKQVFMGLEIRGGENRKAVQETFKR